MVVWIVLIAAYALLAWGIAWLTSPRIRGDDPVVSALYRIFQLYARRVHRLTVEGRENIPSAGQRPILVVANHSAGADPILIQAAMPFEVRWVMARDMRLPWLKSLWEFGRIIFVDRSGRDGAGVREALRHLETGGVLGIFPEGQLERPPEVLQPFQHGVGMMIRRTRPLVLPIVIDGTPQTDTAWASLWHSSRSRLRILPPVDYSAKKMKANEITADLLERFRDATGWPVSSEAGGAEGDEAC